MLARLRKQGRDLGNSYPIAGGRGTITGPPVVDQAFQATYVPVTLENGTSGWVLEFFVLPD